MVTIAPCICVFSRRQHRLFRARSLIGYIDRCNSSLTDHALGVRMSWGRMASIVIAIIAVLGVFVEIPIVSDYAFWVMAGAYLVWAGVHYK